MASLLEDQAAGLRKLFAGARGPVTIAFAGAAGRGALLAGVARGLAAAGKEVVVIDENPGAQGAASAFGLRPRFDLLQAVNRDVSTAQVLLRAETAIRLLPAARAAARSARLDAMERQALDEWLRRLQKQVDFALVDTAEPGGTDVPLLTPQRIVIVLTPEAASITEAYTQMKRLAARPERRRFGVVIRNAAGRAEGGRVFENLRGAARRHLGAEIELLGCAGPEDGDAQRLGQRLAARFLDVPGKPARERVRGIARGAAAAYPVV